MEKVKIDCSVDQQEIIADHLFLGYELGMLPDERAWIKTCINKQFGNRKILNANLLIETGEWEITLE